MPQPQGPTAPQHTTNRPPALPPAGPALPREPTLPTGLLWWRQQNTHLLAQAKLRVGQEKGG